MEGKGLAATTVYTRVCHLSSFFRWLMKTLSSMFSPRRL
jgi:hypothetical protein